VHNEEDADSISYEIIEVKLDPLTVTRVKQKAKVLNTDISTFVKWCIHTGLFLEDVNAFVRSKKEE